MCQVNTLLTLLNGYLKGEAEAGRTKDLLNLCVCVCKCVHAQMCQVNTLLTLLNGYLKGEADAGHMKELLNLCECVHAQMCQVNTLLTLLNGYLKGVAEAGHTMDATRMERVFLFCVTWALGGLLDIKVCVRLCSVCLCVHACVCSGGGGCLCLGGLVRG
jgi:hypothetical protein